MAQFSREAMQRDLEWDVLFQHQFRPIDASADFAEGYPGEGSCTCGWSGEDKQHNTHVSEEIVLWLVAHFTANAADMAEAEAAFKTAWSVAETEGRTGLELQSGLEALVALGWRKINTSDD